MVANIKDGLTFLNRKGQQLQGGESAQSICKQPKWRSINGNHLRRHILLDARRDIREARSPVEDP